MNTGNNDKGIIVEILDKKDLPAVTDQRTEIVTPRRRDPERLIAALYSYISREYAIRLREMTGLSESCSAKDIEQLPQEKFDKAYDFLVKGSMIVAPSFAEALNKLSPITARRQLLNSIKDGVTFLIPIGEERSVEAVAEDFRTFIDNLKTGE